MGIAADRNDHRRHQRVIKTVPPPPVPTPRAAALLSNLAEVKMMLQTTADAVCYRYYPKCEVL